MRRAFLAGIAAVVVAAPLAIVASQAGPSVAAPVAAKKPPYPPSNPTIKIAGPQHWCGSNGFICTEPALTWSEFPGFKAAIKNPMPLTLEFTAAVAGDKISGHVNASGVGSWPFSGTKG